MRVERFHLLFTAKISPVYFDICLFNLREFKYKMGGKQAKEHNKTGRNYCYWPAIWQPMTVNIITTYTITCTPTLYAPQPACNFNYLNYRCPTKVAAAVTAAAATATAIAYAAAAAAAHINKLQQHQQQQNAFINRSLKMNASNQFNYFNQPNNSNNNVVSGKVMLKTQNGSTLKYKW